MKKVIIASVMALALVGCNEFSPVPTNLTQAPVQQPQVVHQAPVPQAQEGFDTGDALVGAAVGAAAGYMLGNSGSNRTTIIDNRGYDNRSSGYSGYRSTPSYRPSYGYGNKSTVTTTTTTKRSSLFGGTKKTITRTVRRR